MLSKLSFLLICFLLSNQTIISQSITQQKSAKTKYFYISIRPGISLERMGVRGYFQDQVQFNHPSNPCLTSTLDVDYDGETILRFELSYKPINFYSVENQKDFKKVSPYELTGFSIIPEFQLMHKWSLCSSLRIYGGAGFGYRLSQIKKNEILYEGEAPIGAPKALQLEASNAVVSCATGLIFRNHYELNLNLSTTQWGNNSQNKLSNTYITMSLGYRF
jgi:hypothetical protein